MPLVSRRVTSAFVEFQVCNSPQDMSLASAIFAAAYEEPGHGEEKAMIFQKH
jgi:hypothetical protein